MLLILLEFDGLLTVFARLRSHEASVLVPNELLLLKLDIAELADNFHMCFLFMFFPLRLSHNVSADSAFVV